MSKIKMLLFDQDGTIIDTEKDGHRVAFNQAFKEYGYDVEWGVEEYHDLLQISGGSERMRYYYDKEGFGEEIPEDEVDELIEEIHDRKTEIFIEMLESGKLPVRPGIRRIMKEARERGLRLGICTTASLETARAIAKRILGDVQFDFVLAGDMVENKKPDPEIYQLALKKSGLEPEEMIVFEDSRNGVVAAKAAGLNVVATTNVYTRDEDLSQADIVVGCLGDPGGEKCDLIQANGKLEFNGVLTLDELLRFFE